MQTGTMLWIILGSMLALLLALFQYAYKSKLDFRLRILLSFMRFLTYLALVLLIINPTFVTNSYSIVPPNLVVLSDNSSSMKEGEASDQLGLILEQLSAAQVLSERFRVHQYNFGNGLRQSDSLSFTDQTTNITNALESVNDIYSKTNTVLVLLTDGNQTLGRDYEFSPGGQKLPVFPVALGDTTRYEDLRIDQLISNRYAFLNNQYPLEVQVSYEGPASVNTQLNIYVDGVRMEQRQLRLTPDMRSTTVQALLKAGSVGLKDIKVTLSALENERNTANNSRNLAIEVVDEQTKVALVSDIMHPDLGALQKAILSNEQRTVRLIRPDAPRAEFEEVDLFVLYQPNQRFRRIFDFINERAVNYFTITGVQTDWNFLNGVQEYYEKENLGQEAEILPLLNPGFSLFDIAGFNVQDFPPLLGELGDIIITKPHEMLLGQRIRGVNMEEPLLGIIYSGQQKAAVLFGESIWKWRMQSYRNQGSFDNFDALIGKMILYLATDNADKRFNLDYNPVFNGTNEARVRATFFDETFSFDRDASLVLRLSGGESPITKEVPMLLKGTYYEADLTDLQPGRYQFEASVEGEGFKDKGNFTILDFDVEKQLLATDYIKLKRLADKTGGALFFPDDVNSLLEYLEGDERFRPVQISKQIVVSLIDFRWLLAIIIASLAIEWFIRKYNGLI